MQSLKILSCGLGYKSVLVVLFLTTTEGIILRLRLQKRACRVILDYNGGHSTKAMQSLKILSVYDRLFLRKAKFMFKVYNGLTPSYFSEHFTRRNEMNMLVNLRSSASGCFIPPLPKKEYLKHSMPYSGCLIWNCLLNNVKCSETAETFHNRCIKWLIQ